MSALQICVRRSMPAFMNPLKRAVDAEDQTWKARKKPSLTSSEEEYWMVTWRNPQTKKHKTWDGDAVLVKNGRKATLYDVDGRQISSGSIEGPLEEGQEYSVGGKEIEPDRQISKGDYHSGRCFGNGLSPGPALASSVSTSSKANFVPPTMRGPQKHSTERRGMPLQPVDLTSHINTSAVVKSEQVVGNVASYWAVNWRKQQSKAHKTWDGDAYVSHIDGKLTMVNEAGKVMGFTMLRNQELHSGFQTYLGGKEIEFDCQIPQSQFPSLKGEGDIEEPKVKVADQPAKSTINVKSFYGAPQTKPPRSLHDPNAEGAVVMKVPTHDQVKKHGPKNCPIVPVVLDPILACRMRDHQKEGVKFLYECVMGLRRHEGQGCILADDMGLGKTLQTIALVWTLLKQNPYAGTGPVLKKVMIVCPVSLINNWKSEFYKWLGRDRVGVATCSKDPIQLHAFKNSPTHQVLIIGYERLRSTVNKSEKLRCFPQIDLIICDEGHRLKSSQNKTTQMFKDFKTRRRIILSGTPIQNDLGEFHAMAEFCNPGLFDDYPTFRRVYEVPILKSRAPEASNKEVEIGKARTSQLFTISKSFVLRREAELLKDYLPPKHEYIVFITPTPLQLEIFRRILNPEKMDDLIEQSTTAESLALIGILTKISNSPILLRATAENAKEKENKVQWRNFMDAARLVPEDAQIEDMSLSGKLVALSRMLGIIRETTEEKCVLVSHYTSTLNILETFCRKKRYSYFRLDGQTPQAQRQEYVNAFNKSNQRGGFIFLLSSKAGGVGINLIGGSRLCLIDSDWNPSHDLQSMARCHRDGQKRPVYIYRFLTAGAIDEKIYQRQVTKLALSDSLIGSASNISKSDTFTRKDLRDIFRVHTDTPSNTHDLLECSCDEGCSSAIEDDLPSGQDHYPNEADVSDNIPQGFVNAARLTPSYLGKLDNAYLEKKKAGLASLEEWKHVNCLAATAREHIQDEILQQLVFKHESEGPKNSHSNPRVGDLLTAIDLDRLSATATVKSVSEVPGGTISFVFERTVNKSLGVDE